MMKTISHFIFVGFFLMLFTALMVSSSQPQNKPELVEVTRGNGTITGSNPNWIFISIDLTNYASGIVYVPVSAEPGTLAKCWGKVQLAEEGSFDPNYKRTDLPPGQTAQLTKNIRKPTKFTLGIISSCPHKPETSNKFKYVVYVKNGKKTGVANQDCSKCRNRYYIRFSGKESLTLDSPFGHAFVTLIKLDEKNKRTIVQSFGIYPKERSIKVLVGVPGEIKSEPLTPADTNFLIEINESDFTKILTTIQNYKEIEINYTLLAENCVAFVHKIASLIGNSNSDKQSCPLDKIGDALSLPSSPAYKVPNLYIKQLLKLNSKRITDLKYCNN